MSAESNMTDYEMEYATFQWSIPEYFNFARDVLTHGLKILTGSLYGGSMILVKN